MHRVGWEAQFGMARIALIHWKASEAAARLEVLVNAGYQAHLFSEPGPGSLRPVRAAPPDAIVIDLTRMPSHGRETGVALRASRATRHVPLVFAGGEPEKVERVRELLPDAVFTEWDEIDGALRRALAYAPVNPVVPPHGIENPDKPVSQKLGIGPDSRVAVIGRPDEFHDALGPVPESARFTSGPSQSDTLRICFVRTQAEVGLQIARLTPLPEKTPLWLCWSKKSSGMVTDVTQQKLRETGLAAGLVDDKICSIDATWSGLRFRTKKKK